MSEPRSHKRKSLDDLISSNIEVIRCIEEAQLKRRSRVVVVADAIASFCGNMNFVYLHILWFIVWLGLNTYGPQSLRFDPPPYGALTMLVSLEAIFLSTFILISQNRQQEISDERNELLLQIGLLSEQETSRILLHLSEISQHLGIKAHVSDKELASPTDASKVARAIEHSLLHGDLGKESTKPEHNS